MNDLIDVTLDYWIEDEHVEYTRKLTKTQLGDLLLRVDEMADDNDEEI